MFILRKCFQVCFVFTVLIFSQSCQDTDGGGAKLPGLGGPDLVITDTHIMFSTVFLGVPLNIGGRLPIPNTKDSYVELSPDFQSSGTLFVAALSKEDMEDGNLSIEERGIPGSYFRPIPNVQGGKLPSVAFQIPQFPHMPYIVIYAGEEQWGYFYPLPQQLGGDVLLSWPYYSSGEEVGMTYVIGRGILTSQPGPNPPKGEPSGYLFMMDSKNIN